MALHGFEQAQDVPDTRQRNALFAGQVLNHLHLADVALRVAAPVGRGAVGLDETRVFIEHQGAGVGLQDLGRDADGVQRLVEVAKRGLWPTGAPSIASGMRHGPPILGRYRALYPTKSTISRGPLICGAS